MSSNENYLIQKIESLCSDRKINELKEEIKNYNEKCYQFNMFQFMKIQNDELIHSNILSTLFDSNYLQHGLSNQFLNIFLSKLSIDNTVKNDILNTYAIIEREKQDIDIVIQFPEKKVVIGIENKIWANERVNQLKDYQERLLKYFPDYYRYLIFLTPTGREPETADNNIDTKVITLSYKYIIEVCEKILEKKDTLNSDIISFLEQFSKHLEVNIMEQSRIKELCLKIFKDHPDAYHILAQNYNIVRTHFVDTCFDDLKKDIEEWLKKQNNKNCLCKIDKSKMRSNKIAFTLNVANEEWPKGIGIIIYKHFAMGIFPFVETTMIQNDTELSSLLQKHFGCIPKQINDWKTFTYFTKELVNNSNQRYIRIDGNDITHQDIRNTFSRFKKNFKEIDDSLKKIKKIRLSII